VAEKKASQHLAVCVLDYNKFIGGTHLPDQLLLCAQKVQ